jgi:hypothetical protein
MAFDQWNQEHHLTSGGWVKGGWTQFGKAEGSEIPRPADALETWIEEATQRSGWGWEEASHRRIWHDRSKFAAERDRLRSLFPSPFMPCSRRSTAT